MWVWVIAAFYFCTGAITLMTFVQILTVPLPIPADQLAVIRTQAIGWSLLGLIPIAKITAAVAIFKMRRIAFYLFSGLLAVELLNILVHLLFFDLLSQITSGSALIGPMVGYGITLAVCLYTRQLKKEGLLT